MFHRHFPYPIVLPWLVYYYPARPCRYRGKEKDGSDPPLFAASAAIRTGVWGRGCYRVWGIPCPPPLWGSLPSKLSLREGCRAIRKLAGEAWLIASNWIWGGIPQESKIHSVFGQIGQNWRYNKWGVACRP